MVINFSLMGRQPVLCWEETGQSSWRGWGGNPSTHCRMQVDVQPERKPASTELELTATALVSTILACRKTSYWRGQNVIWWLEALDRARGQTRFRLNFLFIFIYLIGVLRCAQEFPLKAGVRSFAIQTFYSTPITQFNIDDWVLMIAIKVIKIPYKRL